MSEPLNDTVVITFAAKWLPGLQRFVGQGFYGIEFHPEGDHGATIVAYSDSAMVIIRDPATRLTTVDDKVAVVSLPADIEEQCVRRTYKMVTAEGDRHTFDAPDWMQPEWVWVLGMGLDKKDERLTTCHAWVSPKAYHPDTLEFEPEQAGWSFGKHDCQVRWPFGRVSPWQSMVDGPAVKGLVRRMLVATEYLERLRLFGEVAEMEFFGEQHAIRVTYRSAPEVVVLLMPMRPPTEEELAQEAAEEAGDAE